MTSWQETERVHSYNEIAFSAASNVMVCHPLDACQLNEFLKFLSSLQKLRSFQIPLGNFSSNFYAVHSISRYKL